VDIFKFFINKVQIIESRNMKHAPRHKSILYYIILRIFFNYSIESVPVLSTIAKNYSSKNSKSYKKV
jgi:hypothetical protein